MNYLNIKSHLNIAIIFIFISTPIFSQTIETLIGKERFEIGIDRRFYKRDFTNDDQQFYWDNSNIVVRYGFTEWLTGSLEGFIGRMGKDNFPNRNYYSYRLGCGLGIEIFEIDDYKLMLGIHYLENLDFDKSESNYHKAQTSLVTTLGINKTFIFEPVELIIFVYPAFVQDKVYEYTPRFDYSDTSVNNFGVIVGTDVLAYEHYRLIAEILYANYWQPRFGLGYIF